MTIVDIKNQVISHFLSNDAFDLGSDCNSITLSDDLEPFKEELLKSSLLELELSGMLKKVSNSSNSLWILTKSFDSFAQTLSISPGCAEAIGDTINAFRKANEIPADACDKSKITEQDLLNLVNMCHILAEDTSPPPAQLRDEDDEEDGGREDDEGPDIPDSGL